MNCSDFNTVASIETMATEIACLKATIALILKTIPQADSGKVLTNLEAIISQHCNAAETEIFECQLQQMKNAYRK